ncbi:MAG: endonuclease domain-containing protein [Bacteroidaceae bacterium]|nr:endonuclease domain-containing protein [Bacteroidaceae bacterium]
MIKFSDDFNFDGYAYSPDFHTADKAWYLRLKELAKHNRQNPTEAESAMWDIIRKEFPKIKFRRQHIIGDFIVDFVSLRHKLVIEIDGGYHSTKEQKEYDESRTMWLNKNNLQVIRFTNEEVLFDTQNTLSILAKKFKEIEDNNI